jgi:hypothetical protein
MMGIPAEDIERVIDDLETRIENLIPYRDQGYVNSAIRAYGHVINELRKVLDDYGYHK